MYAPASRNSLVDIDKCVEVVGGNRFELILIAADRASRIADQRRHRDNHANNNPVITALLEIQNSRVDD